MISSLTFASIALTAGMAAEPKPVPDRNVLRDTVDGVPRRELVRQYLLQRVDEAWQRWQTEYEKLKTPEQIAAYQKARKEYFLSSIGGLPERTPLNPRVVRRFHREGFRIETVLFESQPKHYVTAALFLPEPAKHKPPYPGVLVPCGHTANGKAAEMYQLVCALLARNGLAALIYDPIDQGERPQLLTNAGKARFRGVAGHDQVGVGSALLGRNTARFRIWDGMRSIDYLQSRPEVDPKRIGCTGNSGGGTMTSYLMALDERIVAAAPSCYITNFHRLLHTIGPQDAEQIIFGQVAFGMDHADYILMRAPKPTLICAATKDFFDIGGTWTTHRYAKRLYCRMGFGERVDLAENDDKHGFKQPLREAAARWLLRWLAGRDEPVTEPEMKMLTEREIQCTPKGQVMLLEGARSVYDLNRDYEAKLAEQRKKLWAEGERADLLDRVRKIAGIRTLDALPKPTVRSRGLVARDGYRLEKLVLRTDPGIVLPALLAVPDEAKPEPVVLYVAGKGKRQGAGSDGRIAELAKTGRTVLAVDVRGTGETALKEWRDMNVAYLLGRSFMGMRAEDILVCARYAGKELSGDKPRPVDLVAEDVACVPGLHAAALEPQLFVRVKLIRPLVSWSNVVKTQPTKDQWPNVVHAALKTYDLPDLAKTLADKLTIEHPLDATGQPVDGP